MLTSSSCFVTALNRGHSVRNLQGGEEGEGEGNDNDDEDEDVDSSEEDEGPDEYEKDNFLVDEEEEEEGSEEQEAKKRRLHNLHSPLRACTRNQAVGCNDACSQPRFSVWAH